MKTPVITILSVLAIGVPPAAAQAQADQVRTVVRTHIEESVTALKHVERYQGRDRDQNRSEETEKLTRTLKIGSSGAIDVSNISGHIIITSGSGEATVEAVKHARGRTPADAKELLQLVRVEITERNNRAEIRTRYPEGEEMRRNNRRNINVSVHYTISAPPGTRIAAKSISGDVSTKDIKGDVTLESISGAVRVHNGGRAAAAKSVSGNVEVADTEIDGVLEASSISGTVLLKNVKARQIDAGSVSGDVVIQDVDCDRVEGQSISGDVRFSGVLERSGRYDLNSHSGEVRVAISGTPGFELEATSFSGSVRSDFPVTIQGPDTNRNGRRQRALRGVYGDGSAVLDLTTFSGSIVITKR